jgi:7-cyano-7-deazaguanine synthase
MNVKKTIVLLSGGLDSTVSTSIALKKSRVVLALTFDYGQRAARREIEAARKFCRFWKIKHRIVKLPWLAEITNTALVNRSKNIPNVKKSDLNNSTIARAYERTSKVWVPNRNALFINVAAAFAESLDADTIVTGFNKEEAATFPDNSKRFVSLINKALICSTMKRPKVISYTQEMTKADMVNYAIRNGVPLKYCWPCYEGGKKLCGRCESCVRFLTNLKCLTFIGIFT